MNPTPKLRPDVVVVEQVYRGEASFVVKDLETHKYFRFRPVEVAVMRSLDGERTCGEAAAALREAGIGVSEAAVESFAQKLSRMGLIEKSLTERSTMQVERLREERKKRARPKLFRGELLRMRWSMGDPDAAIDRWLPRLRFMFGRGFLLACIGLFLVNLLIVATNWPRLSAGLAQLGDFSAYGVGHLAAFWCTLLVMIFIHEMGHTVTCKYFGGEVHEMGFMLLYFQPAFYANVNDAWTFPELRARLWVTAAGPWIEGVAATVAGVVWWLADPGTMLSQVALLAFLVGGIFSVLTNANPLMPLDGYFALSDWLEIPNLRHRAFAHVGWMVRRRLLRLEMPMPPATERERRIFVIYGLAAIAYLTSVLAMVGLFVAGWASRAFGPVGAVAVIGLILMLMWGQIRSWAAAVMLSIREHRHTLGSRSFRFRSAAIGLGVLVLVTVLRWDITVNGPFMAAPARALAVVAPDSGYVARVLVREGTVVEAGAPLVRLRDFDLERSALAERRAVDSLRLLERRARARAQGGASAAGDLERYASERAVAEARLGGVTERIGALALRARHAGVVLTERPELLAGQWVEAGQAVLTVGARDSVEVRIRLSGGGATRVAPGQRVRLLSLGDVAHPVSAVVASVSRSALGSDDVEARVRLPARAAWRPGASGEAAVVVRRSNILGAMWWEVRRRVRSDVLL